MDKCKNAKIDSVKITDLSISLRDSEGDEPLFDQVDFCAQRGEITFLMGDSGSGKSTLFRLLADMPLSDTPEAFVCSQGRVYWGADPIADFDVNSTIKVLDSRSRADSRGRLFGIIHQDFRLIETLTGYENILVPLKILKLDIKKYLQLAQWIVELLGLEEFWTDREVQQLSGGQRQRIAILRALITQPHIILADEPVSGLSAVADAPASSGVRHGSKQAVLEILKRKADEGCIVIIITHDDTSACSTHGVTYRIFNRKLNRLQSRKVEHSALKNPCPYCQSTTWRIEKIDNAGIVIDVCSCGGIWLDSGELEALMHFPVSALRKIGDVVQSLEQEAIIR